MSADAHDIKKHIRVYLSVFAGLLVLTAVTVAANRLHFPLGLTVAVALFIATVKASLVACYFMHLISEKKLIYSVLALTVCFFLVLMFVPLFNGLDQVRY